MELFNQGMALWGEYSGVIIGISTSVLAIAGTILTLYVKFKPVITGFKDNISSIKDKVINVDQEAIDTALKKSDLNIRIAELEDKINNPLTSEASRTIYVTELKVLLDIKSKLEKVEETSDSIASKY